MTWRTASFAVWALLAAAALVLAALAATGRGGVSRRPMTPLVAYLSGHRVARVAAVVGWMWLGWHLFAR